MTTKLEGPLRREIDVGGQPYTLTIDKDGLRLVAKGKRKGLELGWKALISGDAALAAALQGSLQQLRH
ncbi:hypothetical protein DWG18_10970 [Lysobacter sp. TY2-98]|uniref:hypothetical protein n=1 Tax=Lysobacter sp. TY2-98 TaxID=2290922 RepID=UPI000E2094BE|nr:hypothetical protein [Lysobacter sp. TY2-98]AXK72747.1 hypothetical protein DWG18_10970 [Lysobacter sp. TY2-98]